MNALWNWWMEAPTMARVMIIICLALVAVAILNLIMAGRKK